jgi:aldose 1-epimerase
MSKRFFTLVTSIAIVVLIAGCKTNQQESSLMKKEFFGKTADGKDVYLYALKNKHGMQAKITNYGGIVVSLLVPDKSGKFDDIVLGYDSLAQYINSNSPYFGALIGRYGNRIGKGKFKLNGKEYRLATNNGPNHLHGGIRGFDKVVWEVDKEASAESRTLALKYTSKEGEEGYPGTLSVKVLYSLTDDNALRIEYSATTDRPTVLNLTHHSYFNLAGAGNGDILAHELTINADKFTPIDEGLIPTGERRDVNGTPMDFRTSTTIGARVNDKDKQVIYGKGYDHNWVVNRSTGPATSFVSAAKVYEKISGRVMEVWTTEPGLQFYCGNFLDGTNIGKGGKKYNYRYGFCLETQHFPDSPNKPEFPSTVLNSGMEFKSTTAYLFSTR